MNKSNLRVLNSVAETIKSLNARIDKLGKEKIMNITKTKNVIYRKIIDYMTLYCHGKRYAKFKDAILYDLITFSGMKIGERTLRKLLAQGSQREDSEFA